MNPIQTITLTGADELTDINALCDLVRSNDQVEIGLLYTATPEGRNRYPDRDWLAWAAELLAGRYALHVCGMAARRQLEQGELSKLTGNAARIQVNGQISIPAVESLCKMLPSVITQHNAGNQVLLGVKATNHCLLVDSSGGEGRVPSSWARPDTKKAVGFAGGLGGPGFDAELKKISGVATAPSWIDMESNLRENDRFSITRARAAVSTFEAFQREHASAPEAVPQVARERV